MKFIIIAFLFCVSCFVQAKDAAELPRFMTFRSGEVNVRVGPGGQYPVVWKFERAGFPVLVTAEYDSWSKIKDLEGAEGWVNQHMLSKKRSIVIAGQVRVVHKDPDVSSNPIAKIEPGVVAHLYEIKNEWIKIGVGKVSGWLKRSEVWGVSSSEKDMRL